MDLETKKSCIDKMERWRANFLREQKMKKRSKRTITITQIEIDKFLEFLRESEAFYTFEDISSTLIKEYLFELSERFEKKNKKDISPRTLNLAISRLRPFFAFITDNNDDLLDFSRVFDKVEKIRHTTELPRFTEQDNLRITKALETASLQDLPEKRRKIFFAISVLYYGGLRSAELLSLTPENFELEGIREGKPYYVITFVGKGNKKRSVPIPQTRLANYEDFILSPQTEKRIFPITYRYLLKSVRKCIEEIGVKNFSGLHSFRHNLATLLVEKNINMQVISSILGHSSIMTTQKFYSRVHIASQIEALRLI